MSFTGAALAVATAHDPASPLRHGPVEYASGALERLKEACDEFLALDENRAIAPVELLHAAAAGLHRFAASIHACEQAGIPKSSVAAQLTRLRELHGRSPFVERLQTWPRGYPGDFETVEWLCDATNRAPAGTVAWAIEQYALQSPVAQQHRNKVGLQARAVLSTVVARPRARIASIGCGGCRDLSLVQDYIVDDEARFVLVDADPDALAFARTRLERLADRCTFVHGRVPRVLSTLAPNGPFDLVVAGGLFDYLPDRWAISTLRAVRRMLAPGGKLLFSNIATGNPFRAWLEYLAEWRLIERGEGDLKDLLDAAEFEAKQLRIFKDSTELAYMVEATVAR